jgi:hypothetical protein
MLGPTGIDRPLSASEAYETLDAFGRRYGALRLKLLLHCAVPQGFSAEFVNLLKLNFLGEEAAADMTIDVDVLLSTLVTPAAGGYYQIDTEVRRHCLQLLDAAYQNQTERQTIRVARFMLTYIQNL